MQRFVDTPILTRESTELCLRAYLGDHFGSDDVPYSAAPERCDGLRSLPPAYISTMEFEPLRDEGILYGLGLLQAGVPVDLHS